MRRRLWLALAVLLPALAVAAIDTRDKRENAVIVGDAALNVLPGPDGTISAADRAHMVGEYGGNSIEEPPESTGTLGTALCRALKVYCRN